MKNIKNKLKHLIEISLFLEESEKAYFIQHLEGYTENQVQNFLELFTNAEKKQNKIIEEVLEDDPTYFDTIIKNAHKQELIDREINEEKKEEKILRRLENQLSQA